MFLTVMGLQGYDERICLFLADQYNQAAGFARNIQVSMIVSGFSDRLLIP